MKRTDLAVPAVSGPSALAERIQEAIRQSPRKMTLQLADELGVPEVEIIRAMPEGRATELDVSRWEEIVRGFEPLGSLHVIVSNGAATLEVEGEFSAFSTWGAFFNVQTKSLDLHLRWERLGAVFAVEKASHMDGGSTYSVQFYDSEGAAALKVFLNFGGRIAPERLGHFERLREAYRKPPAE